jgi:hypothetical protein
MKIKFKTFSPYKAYRGTHNDWYAAADMLNKWLEENPNVEIISWQTTPVGTTNAIYITIQYRELEN